MNTTETKKRPVFLYALVVIGTFLIVLFLVLAMRRQGEPPPLDAARKAERAKARAELTAAEAQALAQPAWLDKGKGIVRLPVNVAMETALRVWQDPKAAKAELVARVQKATAVAPPPPAKPSEFE